MVQKMIDAIRAAGGVPSVNHPELRLGDFRRRTARSCSARSCSRSSTAIRPSTTWAAAACPVSKRCGIGCCRAARCSTASRWTMRITSSGRRTRPRRGRGRVGSTCDAAARIARARRGARARRFLFVHRRRAASRSPRRSSALTPIAVEARAPEQIPHPVHRQAGRVLSEATRAPRPTLQGRRVAYVRAQGDRDRTASSPGPAGVADRATANAPRWLRQSRRRSNMKPIAVVAAVIGVRVSSADAATGRQRTGHPSPRQRLRSVTAAVSRRQVHHSGPHVARALAGNLRGARRWRTRVGELACTPGDARLSRETTRSHVGAVLLRR